MDTGESTTGVNEKALAQQMMTVGSFPFCLCHRTMVKAVVSKIAFFRKPVCLHIFHMFMNLICSKLWGMTLGAKTPSTSEIY